MAALAAQQEAGRPQPVPATWREMEAEFQATDFGKKFAVVDQAKEEGLAPHRTAKVRYFTEGRERPRVKLYRDSAAWCPYCQKVWLLLEAKEVDFSVELVNMRSYGDKTQEFLKKVPRGLLPAVELDGKVMTESLDIMFAIESMFPDRYRPMFPMEPKVRQRAVKLLELERQAFGAWCSYLFRPELPVFGTNTSDFFAAMSEVDDALASSQESPWFLPYSHPTIVDFQYVSHIERVVASVHYYKGRDIRGQFPHIDRWLSAFEDLPYYMATKSDYYTHCTDIPPQYGQPYPSDCFEAKEVRALLKPSNLRLPVSWDAYPEPRSKAQTREQPLQQMSEAAWALMKNHEAIARFCSRAAGSDVGDWGRGNPTRSALADPYAQPNESFVPAVDAVLRAVAASLVARATGAQTRESALGAAEAAGVAPTALPAVAACLAYLRDRVGVPRDMQLPAATYLRAYLSEAILALGG